MDEKLLLKTALVTGIIGLILIFLISRNIEISDTTIEKINSEKLSGSVQIEGYAKSVVITDKATIITLSQTLDTQIVAFEGINIREGDKLKITGRISDEKGKKSIIAEKIEVINR